jgi:hypothetical protein
LCWVIGPAGSGKSRERCETFENRMKLSSAYVQMSAVMLDGERNGEQFILTGDLTFAEQCAQSACALIRDEDGAGAAYARERANKQLRLVRELRAAIQAKPDQFVLRPRYGPFPVRATRRRQA